MKPYYQDSLATVYHGDVREVLAELPDDSVHCCVTSPPYWGLRDYGTGTWEGGDENCDHLRPAAHGYDPHATSTLGPNRDGVSPNNSAHQNAVKRQKYAIVCEKCGAKRIDQQLGSEATPDEFVATLVGVFREVRRVLHPSGVAFVNMGDSYASSPSGSFADGSNRGKGMEGGEFRSNKAFNTARGGLKPKDLCLIPFRLAIALQADGWWIRQDIIWAKPNPMPESCTDRCTKAHEYVFLLTKRGQYFWDGEAVKEEGEWCGKQLGIVRGKKVRAEAMGRKPSGNEAPGAEAVSPPRRNLRSVWWIPTFAQKAAHFATFPPKLVEPCVLAGTSEKGVCPECGEPWKRATETTYENPGNRTTNGPRSTENRKITAGFDQRLEKRTTTTGWTPGCECYDHRYASDFPRAKRSRKQQQHDAVGQWWKRVRQRPGLDGWPIDPATVMDPFHGSGTSGAVAKYLGRRYIGIELNAEYIDISIPRLRNPGEAIGCVKKTAGPKVKPLDGQGVLFE